MSVLRRACALGMAVGCVLACASKKPPPPMIETRAADVGVGRDEPEREPTELAKKPKPAQGSETVPVPAGEAPKPLETQGGPIPAAGGGAPRVTLLKPGAEPRKVAKHAFRKGAKQRLKFASTSKITGVSLPLPDIRMSAPINIRIIQVSKDGDAKFTYSAGPFAVGQGGGALGGILGGLAGGLGSKMPERVVATGWVTPQGIVREFNVEQGGKDGDAPVEVGDAFPKEPIGRGAEWQVDVTLDEKKGPVNQTSRYELLSFAGKTVKVKVRRTQQPVGGSADGAGSSEGTLSFTLGGFYPTGRSSMDKAMNVALPGMGSTPIRMKSTVNVTKR